MFRYPALVAAAAALFAMSPALGQPDPAADYPNRAVKIIVSVPAGGGVDTRDQDVRGAAAATGWDSRS